MSEAITVSITLWPTRGWVGSIMLHEHETGRREHWTTPYHHAPLGEVVDGVTRALCAWADWGQMAMGAEIGDWNYTLDRESSLWPPPAPTARP